MKRDSAAPAIAPLAQKLGQIVASAPTPAWMSAPAAAPTPLFAAPASPPPPSAPTVDEAEVARKLAEAMAAARVEGERKGWEAAEADVAAALARLGEALSQAESTARTMVRPYAGELVELALIIARELVGAEVRRDPTPLVQLVERCLDDVAGESSITVRMNPGDRAALLAARPDLARSDLRLIEDPSLARGGCVVESARRLVDARLEERLDNVRDGLRQLLEEAESADPPAA